MNRDDSLWISEIQRLGLCVQTRVPEKSLVEISDLWIFWRLGLWMLVDGVDVMCVQIVIELYMLCKVHKEDEIFGLLGSKLSILQKT